jgi:hypothetical protein
MNSSIYKGYWLGLATPLKMPHKKVANLSTSAAFFFFRFSQRWILVAFLFCCRLGLRRATYVTGLQPEYLTHNTQTGFVASQITEHIG